jgi:hypothetical protein
MLVYCIVGALASFASGRGKLSPVNFYEKPKKDDRQEKNNRFIIESR